MVTQLVIDLRRNLVPVAHGQRGVYRDIGLDREAMADPASANLGDLLYPWDMSCGMAHLVNHGGVNPIEHARKHGRGGLPDDPQDGDGDPEANERVSSGKP